MSATAPQGQALVTDQSSKSTQAVFAVILTILTAGYLLPWAIAAVRGKANSGAIGWINLLLGWTVVGFIWALVLSVTPHGVKGYTSYTQTS